MRAELLVVLGLVAALGCGPSEVPEPSPAESSPRAETVTIYLSTQNPNDCGEVRPVERTVGGRPTLRTGMEQLLAGPTEEERAAGLGGWFSDATRDMLISAERRGNTAVVDFKDLRPVIPNASSSCGSASLLAQLDSTAKQFGASRTLYSINGDVQAFYEWLQMTVPDA
ncbi:MAG TPA: hypothetical protein VHJ78_14075 [Actinomycetota bacterium]|nr:hypothetical protein [Actinomycetota bacterium]